MAKQKFDYFEAFERQTKCALREADLLIEAISTFTTAADLGDILKRAHDTEHEGDEINHSIYHTVATDFITPFDREDILDLSSNLDTVIDYMEDVIQNMYMYDVQVVDDSVLEFAKIIKNSCVALDKAVVEFKNYKKSTTLNSYIIDVNDLEEAGDALFIDSMHDLYTRQNGNPMRVLVWSQVYRSLEKCTDAVEHAADTISMVLLKNS